MNKGAARAANTAPDRDGRSRQFGGMSWVPGGVAGVKRARVYQISSADDFPQPAAVLAMGSI